MTKRNCLTCGQYSNRHHVCLPGSRAKAPTPAKLLNGVNTHSKSLVVSESVVLFASSKQVLTLLPDGSIQRDYTDEMGQTKTGKVNPFVRLLLSSQVKKAKKDFPVSNGEPHKSKIDMTWENYNEKEKSYSDKNQAITGISDKLKESKELIATNDRLAEGILMDAMYNLLKEIDGRPIPSYIPPILQFNRKHNLNEIEEIIEIVNKSNLLKHWPIRTALDKLIESVTTAEEFKGNARSMVVKLEKELTKMLEPTK